MMRWRILLFLALGSGAAVAFPAATTPSVELHGQTFSVELATTSAARQHGLMNRKTLRDDQGMLFVFPVSAPQAFWMKNTLIPLDILYFDDARKLVSMQLEVSPCTEDPCMVYPSGASARYVLELSAGTARRIGAELGNTLTINAKIGKVR